MCASPIRMLRSGPPPPKVALLPDALFFTRAVPITKGATLADAGTQVELALEAASPFPLAQLYYGWFWTAGAERALVFAAYRRRFTAEHLAVWEGAELVLPAFTAILGGQVERSTTVLLNSIEGLTAVHWDDGTVPSHVIFRPVAADAPDDVRRQARDELLRHVGGSRKVIELESPLAADPSTGEREMVFRSGDFVSRIPTVTASALDVRDKAELAALRSARRRDLVLWRVVVGCVAALLVLGVGELALVGGRAWHAVRDRQYRAQKPLVDKIADVHELTNRIEDLRTKRLLPLEMVTQVVGQDLERMPSDLQFTRVYADQARGLYTLLIDGKTENAPQVNVYETMLRNLPTVQSAEAKFTQVQGSRATFTITVVFKPGALNATGTAVVSAP